MPRVTEKSEKSFRNSGVVERLAGVLVVLEQAGHRQHLEAPVGAEEQLRRSHRRFDGAKPQAFGLPRRAAELPRRIDLDLDPAAGHLFQLFLVELEILMLDVVERERCELHRELLSLDGPAAATLSAAAAMAPASGRTNPEV